MESSAVRPLAVSRGGHSNPDREPGEQQSDDQGRQSLLQSSGCAVGCGSEKPRDALSVKDARCVVGPQNTWTARFPEPLSATAGRPPLNSRCAGGDVGGKGDVVDYGVSLSSDTGGELPSAASRRRPISQGLGEMRPPGRQNPGARATQANSPTVSIATHAPKSARCAKPLPRSADAV
jgi:hypothetical protein